MLYSYLNMLREQICDNSDLPTLLTVSMSISVSDQLTVN